MKHLIVVTLLLTFCAHAGKEGDEEKRRWTQMSTQQKIDEAKKKSQMAEDDAEEMRMEEAADAEHARALVRSGLSAFIRGGSGRL